MFRVLIKGESLNSPAIPKTPGETLSSASSSPASSSPASANPPVGGSTSSPSSSVTPPVSPSASITPLVSPSASTLPGSSSSGGSFPMLQAPGSSASSVGGGSAGGYTVTPGSTVPPKPVDVTKPASSSVGGLSTQTSPMTVPPGGAPQNTAPILQAPGSGPPVMQAPGSGAQPFGGIGGGKIPSLDEARQHGKFLGEGEFASVYHFPGSTDAVKYIDPELIGDPAEVSREYDIAKKMADKGVTYGIRGADFAETEEGERYPSAIHMEYLDNYKNVGEDLKGAKPEEMTPEDRAAHQNKLFNVGLSTLKGSRKMHEAGVVHDDLHDENLMTDPKGNVKIVDFGLADENPKNALRELLQHDNKRGFSNKALSRIEQSNPQMAADMRAHLDAAKQKFNDERFSKKNPQDYLKDIHNVYGQLGEVAKKHGHEL